jgi:hypothetical protein
LLQVADGLPVEAELADMLLFHVRWIFMVKQYGLFHITNNTATVAGTAGAAAAACDSCKLLQVADGLFYNTELVDFS